jgi:hypothetical protein
VRVQIRVTGSRVPMGESCGDQTAYLHLSYPADPRPGERDLALDPTEGVLDGRMVRGLDLTSDLRVGQRPQHRDRLDRAEGQLEPRHGRSGGA